MGHDGIFLVTAFDDSQSCALRSNPSRTLLHTFERGSTRILFATLSLPDLVCIEQ